MCPVESADQDSGLGRDSDSSTAVPTGLVGPGASKDGSGTVRRCVTLSQAISTLFFHTSQQQYVEQQSTERMPGYIYGFVERAYADGWQFVTRVDPITGSQGAFKYVMFSSKRFRFLDPPPHTVGLPDDLAPETKLAILGRYLPSLERLSHEDLEERFEARTEQMGHERHASLAELREFDWDRGISYENWERLRAEVAGTSPTANLARVLRAFELVDTDGTDYQDWETADEDRSDWRRRVVEDGLAEDLLGLESVTFDGRSARLRKRTRREILPDGWFRLLATLDRASYGREVRFTFFWEH